MLHASPHAGLPEATRALGRHARRFVLEELLGAGGFGRVFRAFDRKVGIEVALKLPHQLDAAGLLGLKREFRALSGLSHPNLVGFHELFATEASWFFTMDLLRGRDVLSFLSGRGLRSREDREPLADLVRGLEALHAAGVLHGDLKPSNAWVEPDRRGVLLDFGLATRGEARRAGDAIVGTPAYLSPEVLDGEAATRASDAYALGVLLYEAAALERPFHGTAASVLAAKRSRKAPPIRDAHPDVEVGLARVIDGLLDRCPAQRPSLARVREALVGASSPMEVVREPSAAADADPIGREGLLAQLEAALAPSGTEAPTFARFRGAPGIGKSCVLAALATRLRARTPAPLVLEGRASEHETVPYALVDGAIDALARALAASVETAPLEVEAMRRVLSTAFPVLAPWLAEEDSCPPLVSTMDPHEARRRIARALRAVLAHAGGVGGCVILLDDAQWADADGLALLEGLLRTSAPADRPLAVLLAHRDEPKVESALAVLAPSAVTVQPLSTADAGNLAARFVGPDDAARIAAVAGGSPFLIEVLARAGEAALGALVSGRDVDALARRAVVTRLDALPHAARALVDVCSIAGHPIDRDVATRVVASTGAGLAVDPGTLRRIADARLVHVRSPLRGVVELAPYHDRLREIGTELVAPARRASVHLALAQELEARRELDVMRLCHHYRAGGALSRAAALAEDGAREAAAQLAFARAAELYAFALEHRAKDEREDALRVALADALVGAGKSEEAAAAYERAAESARTPTARLERTRQAAEQALRAGQFRHGSLLLDDVLAQVGVPIRRAPLLSLVALVARRGRLSRAAAGSAPRRPSRSLVAGELARIDACASGAMGLAVVDSLRSADLMSEALAPALDHGDGRRLAVCTLWQAAFAANEGTHGEARTRAWLERGRALAAEFGGPYEAGCLEAASALTEFHVGRFRPALGHAVSGSRLFLEKTRGTLKESSTLHIFEIASLAMLGELRALASRTAELRLDAEARGDRYARTNLLQGLPTLAALAADRPARAHADLERALADFDASGYVVQHFMDLLGRVLTLLYEGRVLDARARFQADRLRLARSLLVRTEWTRVHVTLLDAWTALACAREAPGLDRTRWLFRVWRSERWLAAHRAGWARALAPTLRAPRVALAGHPDEAEQILRRARPGLVAHELGLALGLSDVARGLASGDAWSHVEGVVRPDRLAAVFFPGLGAVRG